MFGSHARGEARSDSDLDLLLIFRALPPDREPHAGIAERIADEVAAWTGVPLEVWCVAERDLERGHRTPMLVDALDDGVPLWPPGAPPLRLAFTPCDAATCAAALLRRVGEGSGEVLALRRRDPLAAARRMRDDVVRLCTAHLLLCGTTRPRRADAVRRWAALPAFRRAVFEHRPVVRWVELSFGPSGSDDDAPVSCPPRGLRAAAGLVDHLRERVELRLRGGPRGHFPCVSGSNPLDV